MGKTLYENSDVTLDKLNDNEYRLTVFKEYHWHGEIVFDIDGIVYNDLEKEKTFITEKALLDLGWKKDDIFGTGELIQYKKAINNFNYTVIYRGIKQNNWFDWDLHIDNPYFESVGNIEVKYIEDIDQISKIYGNAKD